MSADFERLLSPLNNGLHQSNNHSRNQANTQQNNQSSKQLTRKGRVGLTSITVYIATAVGALLNVVYFSHLLYSSMAASTAAPVNRFHIMSHDNTNLCSATSISDESLYNNKAPSHKFSTSSVKLTLEATNLRWQEYDKLTSSGEWCHYPEYETTRTWDDKQYRDRYLDNHDPEAACRDVYPLYFSVDVSKTGYLTVSNCTNDKFHFATVHKASETERNSSTKGVQMQWPSTFAYVWCDAYPDPAFVTFHVPRPNSNKQSNKRSINPSDPVQPNVLFLQIDALSYKGFAIAMPKTYDLMERLINQSTSSSDVNAWKFNKFSITGYNSLPAFEAIYGHTRGRRDPESRAWLWRQAKDLGYITSFAETCCSPDKYDQSGSGIHMMSEDSGKYMDYNWMLPFCDTIPSYQEHTLHCTRGKINFKLMYDPLVQAMEHYQTTNQPIFYAGNLNEAHVERAIPARHMDDAGHADYMERLINTPNTVTIFFADHGMQYGDYYYNSHAGNQDHRHPFLYMTSNVKGLQVDQRNLNRLVTPFDLWLTFTHLISGTNYTNPINVQEMGFSAASINTSVDLFRDVIPASRTCHHAKTVRHDCSNELNLLAERVEYCLCQSPFSIMCPRPRSIVPDVWQECTQTWTQPKDFDVRFYANKQSIDDPCEAVTHWCTIGMYRKYQAKA